MSNSATDSGSFSPVFQSRQKFEQSCRRHIEFLEQGFTGDPTHYYFESCRLQDECETAKAAMLAAPAISIADVAHKLELSINEVDELGEDSQSLALLRRGLMALRSGSVTTARMLVNKALDGETDYEFAYEGAVSALADLKHTGLEAKS